MQGCHHQARRAKANSPVIDHWVRVSLCPKSRPGRKHPRPPGLIARLSPWVARATGPYRPATRRTERVRRSFSQRTPFVIGASSFFRHLTFVIRHSQTETIKNPRNNTFLHFEIAPHNDPTHRRQPTGGRARHSVRAAPATSACKISPASPSRPAADQDFARVSRTHFGVRVKPRASSPET